MTIYIWPNFSRSDPWVRSLYTPNKQPYQYVPGLDAIPANSTAHLMWECYLFEGAKTPEDYDTRFDQIKRSLQKLQDKNVSLFLTIHNFTTNNFAVAGKYELLLRAELIKVCKCVFHFSEMSKRVYESMYPSTKHKYIRLHSILLDSPEQDWRPPPTKTGVQAYFKYGTTRCEEEITLAQKIVNSLRDKSALIGGSDYYQVFLQAKSQAFESRPLFPRISDSQLNEILQENIFSSMILTAPRLASGVLNNLISYGCPTFITLEMTQWMSLPVPPHSFLVDTNINDDQINYAINEQYREMSDFLIEWAAKGKATIVWQEYAEEFFGKD